MADENADEVVKTEVITEEVEPTRETSLEEVNKVERERILSGKPTPGLARIQAEHGATRVAAAKESVRVQSQTPGAFETHHDPTSGATVVVPAGEPVSFEEPAAVTPADEEGGGGEPKAETTIEDKPEAQEAHSTGRGTRRPRVASPATDTPNAADATGGGAGDSSDSNQP